MQKELDMMMAFHEQYDVLRNKYPTLLDSATAELRLRLIQEECVDEYAEALEKGDLVKCFDAMMDGLYVIMGAIVSHGFQDIAVEGFAEVHRANMEKIWPDGEIHLDEGGKVIKPPGHKDPDLKAILERVS